MPAEPESEEESGEEESEEEEEEPSPPKAPAPAPAASPSKEADTSLSHVATKSSLGATKSPSAFKVPLTADGAEVLQLIRDGQDAILRMTPRTREACDREGVRREELLMRPLAYFRGEPGEGVRERHVKLRHERYEAARQEKLDAVTAMRAKLEEEGWPPSEEALKAAAGDTGMVAKMKRASEKMEAAMHRRAKMTEEMRKQRDELEEKAAEQARCLPPRSRRRLSNSPAALPREDAALP